MREKSEARHPYPRYTDESVPFPILFKEYLLLTKLLMKMEVSNIVIMVIPPIQSTFQIQSRNQSKKSMKNSKFKCITEILQYQWHLEFFIQKLIFSKEKKKLSVLYIQK